MFTCRLPRTIVLTDVQRFCSYINDTPRNSICLKLSGKKYKNLMQGDLEYFTSYSNSYCMTLQNIGLHTVTLIA